MSVAMQIFLCLAVAVLTVFVVQFLIQARRTAAAVERLAESAARDLRQAAEDVHEVRLQLEDVSGSVRTLLGPPSALAQVVTGVVRAIPAFFGRRSSPSVFWESLVTGAESALHLFRNRKANPPKEETHE
ncbi:MAG TPA: DUF948 domain-containing protein [Holophaga sp.]|nr:DUF948 domain-containing protein [Holophaga sp.]